jgi:trimeric autotransporter adhesin
MKTIPNLIALGTLVSAFNLQPLALAQGTVFTYQGRLNDNASPANGIYDLRFAIYDAVSAGSQVGGVLTNAATSVTGGLFTATLDFGPGIFTGAPRWLELSARTNGASAFTALTPRQPISAAPYALFSGSAGTVSNGVIQNPIFVGTTASTPLVLAVNNQSALRLEPTANSVNVVEGFNGNSVSGGVEGAVIGGGGLGGYINRVTGNYGTISGGYSNLAYSGATVSGGGANVASGFLSTISGGGGNQATANGGTVGGGLFNTNLGQWATIGGGYQNAAYALQATISGGQGNIASNANVTIAGGGQNVAIGLTATISGGYQNQALNTDCTVAGGYTNFASGYRATISGGALNVAFANWASISGGQSNVILGDVSTISGGELNLIQTNAHHSIISGGHLNILGLTSKWSSIGGGYNNFIGSGNWYVPGDPLLTNISASVICGGFQNYIDDLGGFSAICGGDGNLIHYRANHGFIGGGLANRLPTNSSYSTIAGGNGNAAGGSFCTVGGGQLNTASADGATVGGGVGNVVSGLDAMVGGGANNGAIGSYSTIGGGIQNTCYVSQATIGGGQGNIASNVYVTVGGGAQNVALGLSSTISGGFGNRTLNTDTTVSGGYTNTASGYRSTVPGGTLNTASGDYSFAAGRRAKADDNGSFVWSDSNDFDFHSAFANQFAVRCIGGAKFVTAIDSSGAQTAGVRLQAGDNAWSSISDRNQKKNFVPVDGKAVLEKLAAMPVQSWNYKWEADTNTPHIGPMAQDFKAAFYPGRDDKSISTLEFDGVELAAIQALNQKVEQQKSALKQKDAELQELKQRLKTLENIILDQKSN